MVNVKGTPERGQSKCKEPKADEAWPHPGTEIETVFLEYNEQIETDMSSES